MGVATMTTAELMTARDAEELAEQIADIKEEIKPLSAEEKKLVGELKRYMQVNELMEVLAPESNVRAYIKTSRQHTYDLPSLVTHDSKAGEYLAEAARAGVLVVNHSALEAFIKNTGGSAWATALMRYHDEAGGNEALYVERK
jgi:hypothetical protein